MARGPEGKIQDKVIKYAREKHGAFCKKNEVGRYFVGPGFPDYTIYPDHRPAFLIEFKAPGGKLTPLQTHCVNQLQNRGHKVYIVDSVEYGKAIITRECGGAKWQPKRKKR